MKKRKTELIADKKKRGEWVELQFMAVAAECGLPTSKPFGDSENFDVVVGRPGKFVGVQVKCTVFRSKNGEGYEFPRLRSGFRLRAPAPLTPANRLKLDLLESYRVPGGGVRLSSGLCGAGKGLVHPAGGGDSGEAVGVVGDPDEPV